MRRTILLSTIIMALALGVARAAEPASGKPAQPYVNLQTVGLPAVVGGRLVNYIFVAIRLTLATGIDASKIQAREPFLRDALVRAASRTPLNPPADGVHLDDARLKAEILRVAVEQFGPGKVVGVVLKSETPQHRTGVPGV